MLFLAQNQAMKYRQARQAPATSPTQATPFSRVLSSSFLRLLLSLGFLPPSSGSSASTCGGKSPTCRSISSSLPSWLMAPTESSRSLCSALWLECGLCSSFWVRRARSSGVILPILTSFSPKRRSKSAILWKLYSLLWSARRLRSASGSLLQPQLGSSLYMKLMVARMRLRTFQAEVQVSWWQLVKEVQMGRLVSKRPEGVQKQSLGALKGQFSWSSKRPWQRPPEYCPSRSQRQKWKLRKPSRVTRALGMGQRSRPASSFCKRMTISF